MSNVTELFATKVFGDEAMKQWLPEAVYQRMKKTIYEGKSLDLDLANTVADAMKNWAVSKGATHFTHWFQPMTGITAEKHDSFIHPVSNDKIIMYFSGKELVKGESDASSFPNGGIRATFEARGYTAWDPTSYAFIKGNTLCIPTAFYAYGGEALDKKTSLMRSIEMLNKQAMRIVKLFGNEDVKRVIPTVGAEQEYFLIDKNLFSKREDLIYCGRTLFGAKPPKGQELDDHYYGSIKPRVAEFMKELDEELWKLGVLAKTEHNEVAPSQHELAPIFAHSNIATDHNQITMETMKTVAAKHNLTCLLHEKPFDGVNGSGKHNNWSLSTDTGVNLLEPGETPHENAQFLLFLCAVIRAVDMHQDLLRISVASAGNDHRLGASEAPPAIISMFLGDELLEVLSSIENESLYNQKEKTLMRVGVHVLPKFPKDATDRNRTSPFAFTGNKFEFRMPGSSESIASCNMVLNTIVAESLDYFADILEESKDFAKSLNDIIKSTMKEHKRIIFNGNNYSSEWKKEASSRGLLNLGSTPEALKLLTSDKNIALFTKYKVYGETEIFARQEVLFENYIKTVRLEAVTLLDMLNHSITPAISSYCARLCDIIASKEAILSLKCTDEREKATVLSNVSENINSLSKKLINAISEIDSFEKTADAAVFMHTDILKIMDELRKEINSAETVIAKDYWPYPSLGQLLFSVN